MEPAAVAAVKVPQGVGAELRRLGLGLGAFGGAYGGNRGQAMCYSSSRPV
jgi:hypothetical protein